MSKFLTKRNGFLLSVVLVGIINTVLMPLFDEDPNTNPDPIAAITLIVAGATPANKKP